MAYIGNTVENQGFTPAIDYFNGNGVTVTFTLSRPIASVAQVIVAIDNVIQNPSSSFTVAGNAITFSSAPLSGTNNIWVEYTSLITTFQGISQDPTVIGDIRATGGYLAEGDFGNSFVSGAILDYVTGLGRVTVGPAEGIALYNGGTAARTALLTANSTGVGIGGTPVTYKLEVFGATSGRSAITSTNSNSAGSAGFHVGSDVSANIGNIVGFGSTHPTKANSMQVGTEQAYPLFFQTNGTERMRITSAGDVGIGTDSPKAKLNILNTSSVSQRFSTSTSEHNYFHRAVRSVAVTSWATIFTITASGNASNWMRGSVKITVGGHTSGAANGLLQDAVYYIDMENNTMSAGSVSAGTSSGGGTPQFQVIVSGTTWLVQIQSSNGSNQFDGVANVEFNIPNPAGNARTFTIT
jgi:hypothetical protein